MSFRSVRRVCCALFTAIALGYGQSSGAAMQELEDALEMASEDAGTESVGDDALAHQVELRDGGIDLNRATIDDLTEIPVVSTGDARRIVAFRGRYGRFLSPGDIRKIPGLAPATVESALPYLRVEPAAGRTIAMSGEFVQTISRRLDLGVGYRKPTPDQTRSHYAGGPVRSTTRFRLSAGNAFEMFLAADKDPGEVVSWNPRNGQYGPDHVTTSVEIRKGILRRLIVGDFRMSSGLGLAVGDDAFHNRLSPAHLDRDVALRLRSHASAREWGYYRGVAVSIALGRNQTASGFASWNRLDGRPDSLAGAIRRLAQTGLHRTASERAARQRLGIKVVGGHTAVRIGSSTAGLLFARLSFSKAVSTGDRPDQRFDFRGRTQRLASLHIVHRFEGTTVSAEAVLVDGRLAGSVAAVLFEPHRRLRCWLYGRHLDIRSYSLLGSPLKRSSGDPRAETGILVGVRMRIMPRVHLASYLDLSRRTWLGFGLRRPDHEIDMAAEVTADRGPARLRGRISFRSGSVAIKRLGPAGRVLHSSAASGRWRAGASAQMRIRTWLVVGIRSSLALVRSQRRSDRGSLLAADVRAAMRWILIESRLLLFSTKSPTTSLYVYEPDVRYSMAIRSYSRRGERWMMMLTATISEALTVQLKYAMTVWTGATSVGSGLDSVEGDRIRELSGQVRWSY